MNGSRTIFNRINVKIAETEGKLKTVGYGVEHVSAGEFYEYISGETPTGDIVTLDNILSNEYFMLHEIVEISELKKMGIVIDKQTVMKHYPKVYEAHLTAMDYELTYAYNNRDYEWIKERLTSNSLLPADGYNHLRGKLTDKRKMIIKKFTDHSRS
ncbi:hypothetical protein KEJ43_07205 [Candidatus Bathyarchaeota archaeon]|nr:hypothetical protein [Candidatus Bathyarchaeota archaeon]